MKLSKLKRQANIFSRLAVAVLVAFIVSAVCEMSESLHYTQFSLPQFLLFVPKLLCAALAVIHAIFLLRSISMAGSPFTVQNVQHLQWIGWLLVAYEPLEFLMQTVQNRFFPISLGEGYYMTSVSSYGGMFLICGLAVLAVATVFRYGIELQQLSDETL